jgi:hypothetical protein
MDIDIVLILSLLVVVIKLKFDVRRLDRRIDHLMGFSPKVAEVEERQQLG